MKYKVTLNNKTYEVEVEKGEAIIIDEYEAVAPKATTATPAPVVAPTAPTASAPATPVANASANAVKAPLPGVVVQVKAQVGQAVKAGDEVVIIEAMKMENEIVAPRAGTITAIYAQKGSSVTAGAPLFEIA